VARLHGPSQSLGTVIFVRLSRRWPVDKAVRPRFARGQRLGLAKVRVVQASLPRQVRAAADAGVSCPLQREIWRSAKAFSIGDLSDPSWKL